MFVLELTYTRPLEAVDAVLDEHVAWLKAQFEKGIFLASGRKTPRDGGVILAVGADRAAMEALAATDPFSLAGVCEYRITEFTAHTTAPALAGYREQPPA
ncbi:YciI family protein [Streptomyces sp. NPDC058045]|uniref:YciI family protein n=1 Tax=Streptomyces sp. NPDC058045 TaxID=3346311 RepID=UPI0036EE5007